MTRNRLLFLTILCALLGSNSVIQADIFRGKTGAMLDKGGLREQIENDQFSNALRLANLAPAVVVSSGPAVSMVTDQPFSIILSVNKDFGYWSTNGSPYSQFTAGTTPVTINNPTILRLYGQDAAGHTSSTQTIHYVRGSPGLSFTLLAGNVYSVARGSADAGKPVVIPDSFNGFPVTTLRKSAFLNSTALTNITIPAGVLTIGTNAFSGCTSLRTIPLPAVLEVIHAGAFSGCTQLTNPTLPSTLILIGARAFDGCAGLTRMSIPNNVVSIENNAFQGCSGLTNVQLSGNIVSIGSNAFAGCSSLKTLNIPNNVISLGNGALQGCSSLASISLPASLETIGNDAFNGCTGISSVTIFNNVTGIGSRAFLGCTGLLSATMQNSNPPALGANAFDATNPSLQIHVPIGAIGNYTAASNWSSYSNKIVAP